MFVRNVAIHLKANALGEFTRVFDNEVLPILRKQPGFRDENHLFHYADRGGCECDQSVGHPRASGSIQRDGVP